MSRNERPPSSVLEVTYVGVVVPVAVALIAAIPLAPAHVTGTGGLLP